MRDEREIDDRQRVSQRVSRGRDRHAGELGAEWSERVSTLHSIGRLDRDARPAYKHRASEAEYVRW